MSGCSRSQADEQIVRQVCMLGSVPVQCTCVPVYAVLFAATFPSSCYELMSLVHVPFARRMHACSLLDMQEDLRIRQVPEVLHTQFGRDKCRFASLTWLSVPTATGAKHTFAHKHTHTHPHHPGVPHKRTHARAHTLALTPTQRASHTTQSHTKHKYTHAHTHTHTMCVASAFVRAWMWWPSAGSKKRIR